MPEIEIDKDLLELCQIVVAGLDRNPSALTDSRREGNIDMDLYHSKAARFSDDSLQNDVWYGGKWPTDGRYHFSTWKSDNREHGQRRLDVPLSEKEVRDITSGKITKVRVEYY